MSKSLGFALLAGLLAVPSLATGSVLPAAQTLFVAEKASKHPKRMILKVPIAVALSGRTAACVEYGHSLDDADAKGTVTIKVEVLRDGFVLARTKFKGKVKNRHYDGCVVLSRGLEANDTVEFSFVYRKFPRLSKGEGFVVIAGLIPQ